MIVWRVREVSLFFSVFEFLTALKYTDCEKYAEAEQEHAESEEEMI